MVGIGKDGLGLVGKDDFDLGSAGTDQLTVIRHIIHSCELMFVLAEQLTVALQRQHIAVWVDAGSVKLIETDQLVTHLVRRIREHQHNFFHSHRNAPQTNGKAIAGKDGKNHTNGITPQLGTHVGRDVLHTRIIALRPRHNRFGHGDHIPVTQRKALCGSGPQHAVDHNGGEIISLPDDGAANAPGYGPDFANILLHFDNPFCFDGSSCSA